MASTNPAETPAAASPAATPAVVGFQTKKPGGGHAAAAAANGENGAGAAAVNISPERMAYLEATLAKLPELDLSEMARVKTCFSSAIGEGRENIVNGLELRVVLGDLGLYPSEEELKLVLRAYRDRVNLVGLARYLRLYKKEFWLSQVAARTSAQQQQQMQQHHHHHQQPPPSRQGYGVASLNRRQLAAGGGGNGGAMATSPQPQQGGAGAGAHTYTAFSGSHARSAGAAGSSGGSDEDTLRAFVALGGEEDGSGEISATTLREAVRGFGLTLDIDAMIRTVDVHHSGMLDYVDFCALWSAPSDAQGVDSMGHALRQASADAERRGSASGAPNSTGGANRRLMSVLQTPSHRASVVPGQLQQQRRSYQMLNGNDAGMSLPITPRLGGAGRPATSRESGEGGAHGDYVMARPPVATAALPAPISEEEHAMLVRIFLFPDQADASAAANGTVADAAGRRGNTRFMLPSRGAQVTSPNHSGAAAANVTAASATASVAGGLTTRRGSLSRLGSQRVLSHPARSTTSGGTRTRSQKGRTGGGTRSRKGGAGEHDDGTGDDLTADFFSPKNQNVYRPPSPMLLSMRNSTAYRNRVKRLEEQKHAARREGGEHAATMTGYGADRANGSRPKSSTW